MRPNVSKDRPFEQLSLWGVNSLTGATILETKEDINSLLDCGISCSNVGHKGRTFLCLALRESLLDSFHDERRCRSGGAKECGDKKKGKGKRPMEGK